MNMTGASRRTVTSQKEAGYVEVKSTLIRRFRHTAHPLLGRPVWTMSESGRKRSFSFMSIPN